MKADDQNGNNLIFFKTEQTKKMQTVKLFDIINYFFKVLRSCVGIPPTKNL